VSETTTRTTRITTAVVGVLVAGVIGGAALGFSRPGAPGDAAPTAPVDTASSAAPTGLASSPAPTPQPTTSAPLASAAPIRTDLTAEVVAMKAVQGRATQPGDVAGPAVRFTIRLHNATAKTVGLTNAVVNATYGSDQEPAYPLSDGTPFPSTVSAGKSVTGVFVFTVPESARGTVAVSIDTSTADPVVAFTGRAPR
jgi:hypothetical protein